MKNLKNSSGFTLVELAIGLGVMAFAVLAAASVFYGGALDLKDSRSTASRDKVLRTLAITAGMTSSLRSSYLHQDNPELAKCVSANATFDPSLPVTLQDCANGGQFPLILYDPIYQKVAGSIVSSGNVDGPSSAPVRYDAQGVPCTTNKSSYCPIEVVSTFQAQCPPAVPLGPPSPTCDVAQFIAITYKIQPVPGIKPPPGELPVKITPISNTFLVPVSTISGATPSVSPKLLPPPLPLPPPTGGGGSTVANNSPPPIHCPGDTFQTGPNACSCPFQQILSDPVHGKCQLMGI